MPLSVAKKIKKSIEENRWSDELRARILLELLIKNKSKQVYFNWAILIRDNLWDLNRYRWKCIVVARPISAGRAKRWWLCCGGGGSHSRLARAATRAFRRGPTPPAPPRSASHTGKQTVDLSNTPHTHTSRTHPGLPPDLVLVLELCRHKTK